MQTISVGDITLTDRGCSVSEQAKDTVLDVGRVGRLELLVAADNDGLMRMLLRNLTTTEHTLREGLVASHGHCTRQAKVGSKNGSSLDMHRE